MPRGARRAVRRALRSGGAADAELKGVASNENGFKTTQTRYVKLIGAHHPTTAADGITERAGNRRTAGRC